VRLTRSVIGFTACVFALGIGYVSAEGAIAAWETGITTTGPWVHKGGASVSSDSPYSAAAIHRANTLPLGAAEGVFVEARTDDMGAPLIATCDYKLEGAVPAARVFTLEVIPEQTSADSTSSSGQTLNLGAAHSDTLLFTPNGFSVSISSTVKSGNWLRVPEAGPFSIRLRLYETTIANAEAMQSLGLPSLTRQGCRDAG
jgi:hypothetical protein